MIILFIYFILIAALGILSVYLRIKSHSHLTEYGEMHRIKLFWIGTHAGKKYLNEKGLRYKKKADIILILMIMITLFFFGIMAL